MLKGSSVRMAVDAKEDAYGWIVSNVRPGTHGKLEAAATLRHNAKMLAYCWSAGGASGFKKIKHN